MKRTIALAGLGIAMVTAGIQLWGKLSERQNMVNELTTATQINLELSKKIAAAAAKIEEASKKAQP